MRSRAWYAALILLLGAAVARSEVPQSAREALRKGNSEAAIPVYLSWLESNQSDPTYAETILEIAPFIEEIETRSELLSTALEVVSNPDLKHRILVTLAETQELLGNLEDAQVHYQAASFAVAGQKDLLSLFRSALLSFEIGEYRNAEAQARVIAETSGDRRLVARAQLLLSRIYFVTDRAERAFSLLLDGDAIREGLDAEALYWLYSMSDLTGDFRLAQRVATMLAAEYPGSLELALLNGDIARLPTASAIMEAGVNVVSTQPGIENRSTPTRPDEESETQPEAARPDSNMDIPTEHATIRIQTGSFSVRENAEYASKDLLAEGFQAAIEPRVVDGVTYYRVVVPGVPIETVQRRILELKEAGFEGFPLYD